MGPAAPIRYHFPFTLREKEHVWLKRGKQQWQTGTVTQSPTEGMSRAHESSGTCGATGKQLSGSVATLEMKFSGKWVKCGGTGVSYNQGKNGGCAQDRQTSKAHSTVLAEASCLRATRRKRNKAKVREE